MWRLRQASGGEELLHGGLVHAGGGAEDAGADIGNVGEFEEALDGAVFAEGAVQDGEDDVKGLGESAALLDEFSAGVELNGFAAGLFAQGWRGFCFTGEQVLGIAGCDPSSLLGDADGDDLVLRLVDGLEDGGGGEEGDLVLAGAAAEENADAQFFLHVWVQVSTNFPGFVREKKLQGQTWFLWGVFEFHHRLIVVLCGAVVVECVVNVVS